jgi:hypothetical protein
MTDATPPAVFGPCVEIGSRWDRTPHTVVVLGAARGGTSMVAGVLRILGIDMGEHVDGDNNEDQVFVVHRGDRGIFTDKTKAQHKAAYLESIGRHIAERDRENRTWGWKDPLAPYYVSEIVSNLQQPAFIFVARDPIAIAIRESNEERSQDPGATLAYILNAVTEYKAIAQFLAGRAQGSLLISYERALRQPKSTVSGIRDFLCLSPDEAAETKAAAFISPDRGTGRID